MTSSEPTPTQGAPEAIPEVPSDSVGPVFGEPWEAQAFAITLALHQRGLFTWTEWSARLAAPVMTRRQNRARRLAATPTPGRPITAIGSPRWSA